ncbi:DUF1244 domain-containing protein [Maricaulis sp. D1M11]|uniref:DUF1244 domain-containing protein n=1 Tax=Maricaulis sp. D1M11 TaxID=3076117 RepID=UPI0039B3B509
MKAEDLTPEQQDALDAAAFRRLLAHLDARKDVQNIDLMILADFCRNCLSRWYREAADEHGLDIDDASARERVYGMSYADWKDQFQLPASDQQMAAFKARKTDAS